MTAAAIAIGLAVQAAGTAALAFLPAGGGIAFQAAELAVRLDRSRLDRTACHGRDPQPRIGALKILGATNIAKTTRAIRGVPDRALPFLGISHQANRSGI